MIYLRASVISCFVSGPEATSLSTTSIIRAVQLIDRQLKQRHWNSHTGDGQNQERLWSETELIFKCLSPRVPFLDVFIRHNWQIPFKPTLESRRRGLERNSASFQSLSQQRSHLTNEMDWH